MPSFEYDLKYFQAALDELEDFLLSKELFWPLNALPPTGQPPYPNLSLGQFLLVHKRLRSRHLRLHEEKQLTALSHFLDKTHSRWKVKWEGKAARCFNTRLNMWRNFLEEYRERRQANADRYPYEVRLRVMLHLLSLENPPVDQANQNLLNAMDMSLSSLLVRKDFIWEVDIKHGFPEDTFWYLYGRLPENDD